MIPARQPMQRNFIVTDSLDWRLVDPSDTIRQEARYVAPYPAGNSGKIIAAELRLTPDGEWREASDEEKEILQQATISANPDWHLRYAEDAPEWAAPQILASGFSHRP